MREGPELTKLANEFYPTWDALIIPKSRKTEVWTEVEELTVEPPPRK